MKKENLSIVYQTFSDFSELDSTSKNLIQEALQASQNAYAPYSEFHVGAALLLANGEIIRGSNQENTAYPSGLCAERVALFYAGNQYPNEEVKAIAIIAKSEKKKLEKAVTPCGACRQVMSQTRLRQTQDFKIILAHEDGSGFIFDSIDQLLPFGFQFNN